ncbi:hypothetical protein [Pseudoalteromonas sp. SG43-3]|uniref:hypothetical protein n=1 Tax=Pseudoalteromonas sp. SG43-3 TaxID=2760970 RepID=UPI001601AD26|nr:hypothetical protein [Pseudoalteromonas sp. SG43-3]MBB1441947.1 hypothetical protein [Pseudoalteromonas sp. SG43-3]
MANKYRYKLNFIGPDSGINKCSTIIGGVGILLGLWSLAFFGHAEIHGLTLTYVFFLVALNFLTYHFGFLRKVIAVFSGGIAIFFFIYSFPDFISSDMLRSQSGLYFMLVGLYSAAVCFCQCKALSKKL